MGSAVGPIVFDTTPEPITPAPHFGRGRRQRQSLTPRNGGLESRARPAQLDGVSSRRRGSTNFTQDHLDYHETFDAYFDARPGLFSGACLPERRLPAVIKYDDAKRGYGRQSRGSGSRDDHGWARRWRI